MNVLIAEDSQLSRSVLAAILEKNGHSVIEAENGQEAVDKYLESDPDVILMDLMMPTMNGYDATRRIKELSGERFIPIIVITSIVETSSLTESVDCGADDYLNKPYNEEAILAKMASLSRIKKIHDDLLEQEKELARLNEEAEAELVVAEHIYDTVLNKDNDKVPCVHHYMRPVTNFNGDILLAAHTPSGGINVMLGDFTGHGLTAAIGAIPASEIFYQMTAKGFSIGDIAVELNMRLKTILPLNMFCAASMIEIDHERTTLSAWNGSMPDIVITDEDGKSLQRFASSHAALGIVSAEKFDRSIEIFSLQGNERIYMCSDGVIDVRDKAGTKFGMKSYLSLFEGKNPEQSMLLNHIVDTLFSFAEGGEINDDISLVEVDLNKAYDSWRADKRNAVELSRVATEWSAAITFDADTLREANPVPLLLNLVSGINVIHGHKERLYTVLSEFFTNALDHGLLRLDSALKSSPEGFQEYFTQRESRLAELDNASISISLQQKKQEGKWVILIEVKDTGDGFDVEKSRQALLENTGLSGRGIELVRKICESVEYNEKGNEVSAVYSFTSKENC